ncbi:MAG TPA: DUF5069 domain-containing protein, partial [Chthoniobacterales bacterium]|nr:DUF5069 domain-containing protein [Chthoniobacterales bacterium]
MIDIARAKLSGGNVGDYQIGHGMSGMILKHFRITADDFVQMVAQAEDDSGVLRKLPDLPDQTDHSKLSSFLEGLTVAHVPDDLRAKF